jgi:tRNA dimethylallyltransferase
LKRKEFIRKQKPMDTKELPKLIVITGPTATGKTRLAAHVAYQTNGEVISADSRQVYRGMDLGTGKDTSDYMVNKHLVPCHLVDIVDAGYQYNVYEFQRDFNRVYKQITERGKTPVVCGGTGMYVEAAIGGYTLTDAPRNKSLRKQLEYMTMEEMTVLLSSMRPLHNTTDTTDRQRLIRAIEIETYNKNNKEKVRSKPRFKPLMFGIHFERNALRERITLRLKTRLEDGLVEEIERLIKEGMSADQLTYYGLEYRYLTRYVTGQISYNEMFSLLNTAIHQFAKRQMTWFRRMERKGYPIIWLDGTLPLDEKINLILQVYQKT